MRDARRAWLRSLLPGRLWRGCRGVRRSHRGGARRGHDRRRRLVRRRTGLWLPRVPGLRRGLPVRERYGRSACHRHGSERLPVARGNGAADPRGVRPSIAVGGAVDSFLLAYDGFDPGIEGLREALTSTGNGYLCTRGAAEWE